MKDFTYEDFLKDRLNVRGRIDLERENQNIFIERLASAGVVDYSKPRVMSSFDPSRIESIGFQIGIQGQLLDYYEAKFNGYEDYFLASLTKYNQIDGAILFCRFHESMTIREIQEKIHGRNPAYIINLSNTYLDEHIGYEVPGLIKPGSKRFDK